MLYLIDDFLFRKSLKLGINSTIKAVEEFKSQDSKVGSSMIVFIFYEQEIQLIIDLLQVKAKDKNIKFYLLEKKFK